MRAMKLRRLVVWSVLGVVLAALVLALVIVWTANEREWYIDSAGISATLDMTLTDAGRWIATALLGVLITLVLLAFAVELATANRSSGPGRTGPVIPSLEERSPGRTPREAAAPPPPIEEHPTERVSPARYASTIVGDQRTRRVEQSLPPTGDRLDGGVRMTQNKDSDRFGYGVRYGRQAE